MLSLYVFRYEQAKITTFVADLEIHFWVGLKYNNATQSFEWSSGKPVEYTHWAEYEPGKKELSNEKSLIKRDNQAMLFQTSTMQKMMDLVFVHICIDMKISGFGKLLDALNQWPVSVNFLDRDIQSHQQQLQQFVQKLNAQAMSG